MSHSMTVLSAKLEDEVSKLASELLGSSVPDWLRRRCIDAIATFDVPESALLVDRVIQACPPKDPYRIRLQAKLRASAIVREALTSPDRAADLSQSDVALPDGSGPDLWTTREVLTATLRQIDGLVAELRDVPDRPTSPEIRAERRLAGPVRRRPNATRSMIVKRLTDSFTAVTDRTAWNPGGPDVAIVGAQLQEVTLTEAALASQPRHGPDSAKIYLKIGNLKRAIAVRGPTGDFADKATLAIRIALVEGERLGIEAARARLAPIEERALAPKTLASILGANVIQDLVDSYRSISDIDAAISLATKAADGLNGIAAPSVYSCAIVATQLEALGYRDPALALCRRGMGLFQASTPSAYPEHHYLVDEI